jgi:membrane fusion protein (multidrug efflux system)
MKQFFLSNAPHRTVRGIALIVAFCVLAAGGYWYWSYSRRYVSTDNAYVGANVVAIASQVTGPVLKVYPGNNDRVENGAPLFDIDPEAFQLAVNKAEANLRQRQAELLNARTNEQRVHALVKEQFLSSQAGDDATMAVRTAQAAYAAAKAAVEQAKLDLAHTHVTAPVRGVVANLTLRPGAVVQASMPLFALVATDQYWVDANFKETELEHIRPGDSAEIRVDSYPDHVFQGRVDSLSGGAGSAFSLLPAQNATGNWVKVTQRVPVRVVVLDPDPNYPLRIGTSAEVTVRLSAATREAKENVQDDLALLRRQP